MFSVALYDLLRDRGLRFFTGIPDSLLSGFCRSIASRAAPGEHIVVASEGAAVAAAAGIYLATGETPVVYLQNSGLLNALNPYLSLCHPAVYDIPIIFVVGWRGEPGSKDEPQHKKTGEITPMLLGAMDLDVFRLTQADAFPASELCRHIDRALAERRSAALLVSRGVLEGNGKPEAAKALADVPTKLDAISAIVSQLQPTDAIVAGIGHVGREVYAIRRSTDARATESDFLCVGGMGHASQLALATVIAGATKRVWCLDGDGSFVMHMGAVSIIRDYPDLPFVHVLFDNGAHVSVGGQPVCGTPHDYAALALALGYPIVLAAGTLAEVKTCLDEIRKAMRPSFLAIKVQPEATSGLPRPTESFNVRKQAFMRHIRG